MIRKNISLYDVGKAIQSGLLSRGYHSSVYCGSKRDKNGFLILTDVEQIDPSGKSLSSKLRFNSEKIEIFENNTFSFSKILNYISSSLFKPHTGRYRLFIFDVKDLSIYTEPVPYFKGSIEQIKSVIASYGFESMPENVFDNNFRNVKFKDGFSINALVFEFGRRQSDNQSFFIPYNHILRTLSAEDHLLNSGIWNALDKLFSQIP